MTLSIVDRIAAKILGSPIAQVAERELAEDRLAQQHALAAELAAIEKQALQASITADRERALRLEELDRLQAALDEWRARNAAHERAVYLACRAREDQCSLAEKKMIDLASPSIASYVAALYALAETTRDQIQGDLKKNGLTDASIALSNKASIDATLTAIQRAVDQAKALVFEPLSEADLVDRLTQIRDAIPPLESFLRRNPEAPGRWWQSFSAAVR